MQPTRIYRLPLPRQLMLSLLAVCLSACICAALAHYLHYRVIGFLLLLTVSAIAVFFDMLPVLLAALLTALIWDFFFLPPRFTLQVGDTEDRILLLTYFLVATVSAVLTSKARQIEQRMREEESRANAIQLYNTLLNSLSHELRTPIASIIGATDNLQAADARLTPHNRYELLAQISSASLRLNRQVENLLNMSRLESGVIRPKADWCDINELVYELVRRAEADGNGQRIRISINPDLPLFRLDQGMLEQVLGNLLNNALNHTPAGSHIAVSAACYADVLHLTVEDDGPGFPETETEFVFDKFYRLQHTKAGGTGLGLSIVKGFTEALGGTVGLDRSPMGGARFTLQLPVPVSYLKNLKHE